MRIRITSTNAVPVLKQLRELPEKVLQAAAKGLADGLQQVVGVSQNEYLAGPRPARLGEVTGRLRRSIESRVESFPGRGVVGQIGTVVPYGAFHEFGFHGTQQVSAHERIMRHVRRAGGSSKPKATTVRVKAHTRKLDYAGRPFVRPALEANSGVILASIRDELSKV